MISRQTVNRFAHQSSADLHIAQQDVVLLYALDLLRKMGVLDGLAFKGGTYLRKMILGQDGRFSEDLDFTAAGIPDDPGPVFDAAFQQPHHGVKFELVKPSVTENNWRSTVSFKHAWDEGSFTLEVSYREQPFLPVENRAPLDQIYFRELPFTPPVIPCLQMPEALAEKLRATQQRASERDIYDLTRYATKTIPQPLVRLLATAKLWSAHDAFDPENLLAKVSAERKDWPVLRNLVGRKDKTNWNDEARKAAARFAFLRDLTAFERNVIADHRRHLLEEDLRAEVLRSVS